MGLTRSRTEISLPSRSTNRTLTGDASSSVSTSAALKAVMDDSFMTVTTLTASTPTSSSAATESVTDTPVPSTSIETRPVASASGELTLITLAAETPTSVCTVTVEPSEGDAKTWSNKASSAASTAATVACACSLPDGVVVALAAVDVVDRVVAPCVVTTRAVMVVMVDVEDDVEDELLELMVDTDVRVEAMVVGTGVVGTGAGAGVVVKVNLRRRIVVVVGRRVLAVDVVEYVVSDERDEVLL
mmetsp:Transcript_27353/g.63799  ORF Transcript_27353/g.63799 Transcript_27353/m.63799 type:complete len:244 (-) Transcript_27353:994-1725(-)